MSDGTTTDIELVRIARECSKAANSMRLPGNPEITAALINYRAAQLIDGTLRDLLGELQLITRR
jgi:hypothetical protein